MHKESSNGEAFFRRNKEYFSLELGENKVPRKLARRSCVDVFEEHWERDLASFLAYLLLGINIEYWFLVKSFK